MASSNSSGATERAGSSRFDTQSEPQPKLRIWQSAVRISSYASFQTRKEAADFRENGSARKGASRKSSDIRTVEQGLSKWLDILEKDGTDGRDPITKDTLKHYEWRRDLILRYDWPKELHELGNARCCRISFVAYS
jgi:hypothetical protein